MPILVNLRHLEAANLAIDGQVPVDELDIDTKDETIRLEEPLDYRLEVQKVEDGLLVRGWLSLRLDCQCVRCLKPFKHQLTLDGWSDHLPLTGEDAVPVNSDCVDLTPYIREDILLGFPQHPLCKQDCRGLPNQFVGKAKETSTTGQPQAESSAWDELNKLKF